MVCLTIGAHGQVKKLGYSKPTNKVETKTLEKTDNSIPTGSMKFIATAYSLRGKMANGEHVHTGAIAADPKVLPIGTVVLIDGMGTFIVKDTGGKVKGNKVDIWMNSAKQAVKFGKRVIHIKILKKPKKRT